MRRTLFFVLFSLGVALSLSSCGDNSSKQKGAQTQVKKTPVKKKVKTIIPAEVKTALNDYTCLSCHTPDRRLIGPSFKAIAAKGYSKEEIKSRILKPKPEEWPEYPPMDPVNVPEAELNMMADWILSLKK